MLTEELFFKKCQSQEVRNICIELSCGICGLKVCYHHALSSTSSYLYTKVSPWWYQMLPYMSKHVSKTLQSRGRAITIHAKLPNFPQAFPGLKKAAPVTHNDCVAAGSSPHTSLERLMLPMNSVEFQVEHRLKPELKVSNFYTLFLFLQVSKISNTERSIISTLLTRTDQYVKPKLSLDCSSPKR